MWIVTGLINSKYHNLNWLLHHNIALASPFFLSRNERYLFNPMIYTPITITRRNCKIIYRKQAHQTCFTPVFFFFCFSPIQSIRSYDRTLFPLDCELTKANDIPEIFHTKCWTTARGSIIMIFPVLLNHSYDKNKPNNQNGSMNRIAIGMVVSCTYRCSRSQYYYGICNQRHPVYTAWPMCDIKRPQDISGGIDLFSCFCDCNRRKLEKGRKKYGEKQIPNISVFFFCPVLCGSR